MSQDRKNERVYIPVSSVKKERVPISVRWNGEMAIVSDGKKTWNVHFGGLKNSWIAGVLNVSWAFKTGTVRVEELPYDNSHDPNAIETLEFADFAGIILPILEKEKKILAKKGFVADNDNEQKIAA